LDENPEQSLLLGKELQTRCRSHEGYFLDNLFKEVDSDDAIFGANTVCQNARDKSERAEKCRQVRSQALIRALSNHFLSS